MLQVGNISLNVGFTWQEFTVDEFCARSRKAGWEGCLSQTLNPLPRSDWCPRFAPRPLVPGVIYGLI